MNTGGNSGPACRDIRQLLGVYVVGAIDPAERALVDEHLAECQSCRDELAGLAGLPAMLSRVPAEDVEQLSLPLLHLPEAGEPSDELLNSLLKRVSAKRKSRIWRNVAAVAAAAVIAAGGAATVSQLTRPATSGAVAQQEWVQAVSPAGHISAVVNYAPVGWGTAMRVQVSGIKPGTVCQFWVVNKNGTSDYAGAWTVAGNYGRGYGEKAWYPASSVVPANSVRGFQITSGGKVLLNIHAS
ncbi:MAG TPA: zf-HC2 domain-containing protein [Streptosporangiaceae bacterium]|nr:zf-HC2 domain-containing protein [Streptosporangiaceae bacterium]